MSEEKKGYYNKKPQAVQRTIPGSMNIQMDIKEIRKTMKGLSGSDIFLFKINATLFGLALYAIQNKTPDETYLKLLDRLGNDIINVEGATPEQMDKLLDAFKSFGGKK